MRPLLRREYRLNLLFMGSDPTPLPTTKLKLLVMGSDPTLLPTTKLKLLFMGSDPIPLPNTKLKNEELSVLIGLLYKEPSGLGGGIQSGLEFYSRRPNEES